MDIPLVELRVCADSTCIRQGSLALIADLREYLRNRNLDRVVRVAPCRCIGGCGYGPNMAVPPSPQIFLAMDIEKAKRLLRRLGIDSPPPKVATQGDGP